MWAGKRVFDTTAAAVALMLIWPLLIVIGIAIKLGDDGPVFLRQFRIGRRGLPFRIWKFRTMVPNAGAVGALTLGDDPRVTRVGKWLRKFKLDELPQLINVVAGDMSLVGPRPELQVYVDRYTPEQRRVLELTPGITGIASIRYRNESAILGLAGDPEHVYVEHIMPAKIRLCLAYGSRATFWSDLVVVASTIRELIRDPVPAPHSLSDVLKPARLRGAS